jgi:Ulp1 family protease
MISEPVSIKLKEIPANARYILQPESLARLAPGEWFNDELVNGYVQLVNQYCTSPSTAENSQVDIVALESTVLPHLGREDFINRDEAWTQHF